MINKVYGMLGLASRARKVVSGTDAVIETINKREAELVIIAQDASEKTIKNMKYHCEKNDVEIVIYGTIDELSKSIGKNNRAIIAIIDKNFAEGMKKVIHGGEWIGKN